MPASTRGHSTTAPTALPAEPPSPSTDGPTPEEPPIPEHVARFLGRLPDTGDLHAALLDFRDALRALLGDVDRIALNINYTCDLVQPVPLEESTVLRQIEPEPGAGMTVLEVYHMHREGKSQSLLRMMAVHGNYNFRKLHAPLCYDYYFQEKEYLATIILTRAKSAPEISERTREAMTALEPFFHLVFSNIVARYKLAQPGENLSDGLFNHVLETYDLSDNEIAVLALQAYGFDYRHIAEKLHISVNTVAKHVKSIHRKTGCASYLELFGRYVACADEADGNAAEPGAADGIVAVY